MSSPASISKHPVHPMLVVFPIGLWVFSFLCDLVYAFGLGTDIWKDVAHITMGGGIVGALFAAVPGFLDFRSLAGRPKAVATLHMGINLSLVILFLLNFWLRSANLFSASAVFLSLIGVAALAYSGWLGGELVYVLGIAVDTTGEYREEAAVRGLGPAPSRP